MSILEDIKLLKTEIKKNEENSVTFIIEPFCPGFGTTIGHALRRILLSSLKGSAPTSLKIEGVTHEFSTIKGVREDVVDIVLNIKQLNVRSFSEEPEILKLSKKGHGVVTAADFQKNSQIKILEPDKVIAHLDSGAKLIMEVVIEQGSGYVPVEKRKDEKLPPGTIAIDAIYNPVKKMSYEVVNTRVGGMTNYDKLILNISTNGSVTPENALRKALEIVIKYFSQIQLPKSKITSTDKKISMSKKPKIKKKKALKTPKIKK